MPCYTIRTVSAELTVADADILLRGMVQAKFRNVHVIEGGIISAATSDGRWLRITGGRVEMEDVSQREVQGVAEAVTRAYAAEVIRTGARKYGFALKTDTRNPSHMTMARRTY